MDRQPVEVLLIDPYPEDRQRFVDSLEMGKIISEHVHTASSGDEALAFLEQRGEYEDAPRPDLIMLEVELPEMDGHKLLEDLSEHPELSGIPVIVLSASDHDESIAKSYNLGANAYVRKPVDPDEFIETIRSIEDFWIEFVRLPPNKEDEDDELPR